MGLKNNIFKSGIYLFIARGFDKLTSLISILILARLLEPSEFGLIALALIVVSVLESITAISLETAIINKKEINRHDLDVAWTYGRVIRSLMIASIVILISPFIANFFEEPRLEFILQVMMLGQILNGFQNIGMILYIKNLDFQKDFYLSMISRILRIFVLIFSAFYFKNVWAFVFAYLAMCFSSAFLSYYLHPFRPNLNFNTKILKDLFSFGGWVFLSQLIITLNGIIDRSFIGRIMTATFLGYYQIAFRFGNELPNEMKSVINQVMFPFYSIRKDDLLNVKKNFLFVFKTTSFIIFPTLTMIYLLSDYLVILLLGDQWTLAIPPLKILAFVALFQSLTSSSFPLLKGLGFPRYETYLTGIMLITSAVIMYPLISKYGINGAAMALLLGQLITFPFFSLFDKKRYKHKCF